MIHRYLTKATIKSLLTLAGVIGTILLGVGCGGSGSTTSIVSSTPATTFPTTTTTTTTTQPTNIDELCSTSCTDGAGDTISQVRLLSGDTAEMNPGARVVSFQLTLKNETTGVATLDLLADLKILDSEQHQHGPEANVRTSAYRAVAACEDVAEEITLKSGEMHSFTVCFDLPNSKDFPRAVLFGSGAAEIPFK
jgi:hypothetical protein